MDYMIIQENISNYLYYFRLLIINLGAYYIFLKTVKNKSAKLTKNVIFLLIFIVTAIELYETINGNELKLIIVTTENEFTITEYSDIQFFLKKYIQNTPFVSTTSKNKSVQSKHCNISSAKSNNYSKIKAKNNLFVECIEKNLIFQKNSIKEIRIICPIPDGIQNIALINLFTSKIANNTDLSYRNFIKNADAIIFLKPIKNATYNSTLFKDFFRENYFNKKRDSLFLILDQKSDIENHEYKQQIEHIIQLYKNDILPTNIIGVDSKVETCIKKCKKLSTEDLIIEYFDKLPGKDNSLSVVTHCWIRSMQRGGIQVFYEKMEDYSNFNNLHSALYQFTCKYRYSQLIRFLENIKYEYQQYIGIISALLEIHSLFTRDPVACKIELRKKQSEIKDIDIKLNSTINTILEKYMGNAKDGGVIQNAFREKMQKYKKEAANLTNFSDYSMNKSVFNTAKEIPLRIMKKLAFKIISDLEELRSTIITMVIEDCNQNLIQYDDVLSNISIKTYQPVFTENDFLEICNNALKEPAMYINLEICKIPIYNLKIYTETIEKKLFKRLDDDIYPKMIKNTLDFVVECVDAYKLQLIIYEKNLKTECEDLPNEINENKRLSNYNDSLKSMQAQSDLINELVNELKNFVVD